MLKHCFHSRQTLKFADRGQILVLQVLDHFAFKCSAVNSGCNFSCTQIGHLLRSPVWHFRYLPWDRLCMNFQNKRHYHHYVPEIFSHRWLSKMAASQPVCSKESELKENFEKAFHLIDKLLQQKSENSGIRDAILWLRQVIEYNIQGGKKVRGLALVVTFSSLYEDIIDSAFLDKAFILGWCIEMLQAFFVVSDDIMDQSQTRRGKACWYRKVGLGAVNDAIMLEAAIYKILKDHFEELPCYKQILEEFRETTWKTTLGQCMDMKSSPGGHPNWNLFTQERYETIVKHKTTWYTFCLPIHLAVILGEWDFSAYKDLEDILIKLGYYFQVQDDYLDCFGDPLITGKYGSDIEDGKCTWLILEALKIADENEKKILKDNYGMNFHGRNSVVKKLYEDLNIPGRYKKFESDIYQEILDMIKKIQPAHVKCVPILLNILEKLHRRDK